jgi:hypothetical protein
MFCADVSPTKLVGDAAGGLAFAKALRAAAIAVTTCTAPILVAVRCVNES